MVHRLDLIVERLGRGEVEQRLRAISELRAELDSVEEELVAAAVRGRLSWTRIGSALGVSKQAAHAKHRNSPGVNLALRASRPPVLSSTVPDEERTSLAGNDVREAVRLAREEAAALGRRIVGTEHLLIGVLRLDEGPAAAALRALGVTLPDARGVLEPTLEVSVANREGGSIPDTGDSSPAVSPLARQVLERSLRNALRRRGGRLSAAGLLVEVLADLDGGAARTLVRLGVNPQAVIDRLGDADRRG